MPPKRPTSATIMALVVLFLGGANALTALHGLVERDLYMSADVAGLLWLRVGAAALWAIVWGGLAITLWRGWSRTATIIAFWVYGLTRTSLWATNALTTYEQGRWFFVALIHVILAAFVTFVLTRPTQIENRPTQ